MHHLWQLLDISSYVEVVNRVHVGRLVSQKGKAMYKWLKEQIIHWLYKRLQRRMSSVSKAKIEEIERMRWKAVNLLRTFFPGSFSPVDSSIVLDSSLSELALNLVYEHELLHARFAKKHYGEMISRLEALSIMVSLLLNIIREQIIRELCLERFGTQEKLERVLNAVANDPSLRQAIREKLASIEPFIKGLKFIEDLEARKELLLSHWLKTQEGGAYWLSIASLELDEVEGKGYLLELKQKLLNLQDHNGEGYRLIDRIARLWGGAWVYNVIDVCLSPDIRKIPILHTPIKDLEAELATKRFSPDRRLEAIVDMAENGSLIVPRPSNLESIEPAYLEGENLQAFQEIFRNLDPDNPNGRITVEQFNDFWNTIDADQEFADLMNSLMREAGYSGKFDPIQLSHKDAASEPFHAIVRDNDGGIVFNMGDDDETLNALERRPHRVTDKELLMHTMKKEGLI